MTPVWDNFVTWCIMLPWEDGYMNGHTEMYMVSTNTPTVAFKWYLIFIKEDCWISLDFFYFTKEICLKHIAVVPSYINQNYIRRPVRFCGRKDVCGFSKRFNGALLTPFKCNRVWCICYIDTYHTEEIIGKIHWQLQWWLQMIKTNMRGLFLLCKTSQVLLYILLPTLYLYILPIMCKCHYFLILFYVSKALFTLKQQK